MISNKYGLEKTQIALLDMMKEVDQICKKNNIHYSLHGGTLIGAIREKGFLEWDDDMDISMTRKEFDNFKKVFKSESKRYYLDYLDTWLPRVMDKDVTKQKVFIDIFIYDNISENIIKQKLKIFLTRLLQGMLKEETEYRKFSLLNRILLRGTYLLGKGFTKKQKLKWHRFVSSELFSGNGEYIHRANDSFKGVKEIHKAKIMKKYMYVPFEDTEFQITKDYDTVLRRSFGNGYMTPPPMEERKPLHEKQRNRDNRRLS